MGGQLVSHNSDMLVLVVAILTGKILLELGNSLLNSAKPQTFDSRIAQPSSDTRIRYPGSRHLDEILHRSQKPGFSKSHVPRWHFSSQMRNQPLGVEEFITEVLVN